MSYRTVAPALMLVVPLVLAACGPSSVAEDADSATDVVEGIEPGVLETAQDWLALLDADDFQGSWEATGELFRNEVNAAQWRESMEEVRREMGAVTERTLHDQTLETVMPGVPVGRYVMLEYRTVFEKQPRGAELVVTMEDEHGEWQVIGYFLQ